jgi:hypothetical protein
MGEGDSGVRWESSITRGLGCRVECRDGLDEAEMPLSDTLVLHRS